MFDQIRPQDKVLFTKHLAVMLKAGIPLVESLDSLAAQTKSAPFKKVINSLATDVSAGKSLAQSCQKYPQVFSQIYLGLIGVGEDSGTLEESLDFLSQQLTKDYNLNNKIKGAMLYPSVILLATVIMGAFISLFILPKLVDFFSAFDTALPLTTVILIAIANFMKDHGLVFFFGLFLAFVIFQLLIKTKPVKPIYHQFLLRIPIFGDLISMSQISSFSRNLGILLKSGVPVQDALNVTRSTLSNLSFDHDVALISKELNHGKSIEETLFKIKHSVFPPLVREMVGVGERTGKLDETLTYLGDFYDEEIDGVSKNLTTLIEPLLLIFIGLVVGFVALAIISPIYQLTGSIHS